MKFKMFLKRLLIISFGFVFMFVTYITINHFINSSIFNIKNIEIVGTVNSNQKLLKNYFKKFLGKNIFKVKGDGVLTEDVWVEKYEIVKKFPSTLQVKIYEKRPVIKFSKRGKCYIKTADNSLIKSNCNNVNVFVMTNIDNDYFNEFIKIYRELNNNLKFYLYSSYFVAKQSEIEIIGYYDSSSFLGNYRYFEKIAETLYEKIDYADLRISERIYVSGVKRERG
ncbi:FtsQ-type POTRA domain-containing protein [Deferribacter autotrophicus]|uniref:FtsQ-type POTRA domain-containing protein n=1 Tax=Deferribacter autotrophicus TaxID=500465 RepID=A0A5A8F497_9BACT|nr:FtsQ-type POTRA domain-containing protein [Deferribacter autotrophicus]KAA0257863.1 FtsQ-type POTRA domain-containing protein [Deferribacter autotrophicus]